MKRKFFVFTVITILVLSTNSSYAQSGCLEDSGRISYTPAVDSILNLISTTSGFELLEHYACLHKALYQVNDIALHLKFNREFAEEELRGSAQGG